jgi:hypothetical protein
VTPARCPAGTVLDRDQRVDPPEEHGIHMHEVHSQNSLGLGGEELSPGRSRSARGRIDTGIMQNLPHGGGGDAMAKSYQFALHPPVSPAGILDCHANHDFFDGHSGRGTSGLAACRVVPLV